MTISPRQWALRLHRWAGLLLAGFLIVTGATGALLAFKDPVEAWLAPQLMRVEPFGDPLPLSRLTAAADSHLAAAGGRVTFVRWPQSPEHSLVMYVTGGELDYDELFLDPYTGKVLGSRAWGEWRWGGEYVLPLIYKLHYALAIPGEFGVWLLGVVALLWCFDCFVGFYLTLPRRRRQFWRKWQPAWRIEWRAGLARRVRDLHVAVSLWLWGMFLMFAASSVMLNLHDAVYHPLVGKLMTFNEVHDQLPRESASESPMSWSAAEVRARALMAEWAEASGFTVARVSGLGYSARGHYYQYRVHASWDLPDSYAQTRLYFDASSGELIARDQPYVDAGNALSHWLSALHMGKVFGTWYQVLVALAGVALVLVSVTGVLIWRRKRLTRPRTEPAYKPPAPALAMASANRRTSSANGQG